MARIINFPHRQAPGGPVGLARSTAFDGHANQARRPFSVCDGQWGGSPTTAPERGAVANASPPPSRQPCADEMLRAARQFPDLYLVREPRDYAERFTFVPSDPPPLTFAGKLLDFMRLNGEAISFFLALAAIALLVGTVGGAFVGWLA